MKKIIFIAYFLAFIFILTSCRGKEGESVVSSASEKENRVRVVVQPVQREDVAEKIVAKGSFESVDKVVVSPKRSGKIMAILVKEAQRVEKGQTLIQMDDTQARLDLKRAQASVEELRARLESAGTEIDSAKSQIVAAQAAVTRSEADLNLKAIEKERLERLVNNQSIPQQRYDYAKSAFDMARASLEASQAGLKNAELSFKAAQSRLKTSEAMLAREKKSVEICRELLEDTIITSPISGVVTQKIKNNGEMAEPANTVLVIEDINLLEFKASVSSIYLQKIRPGLGVEICPDGFDTPIKTTITRVNPGIDPLDRSLEIVCEVQNPDQILKPGLFAKIQITSQVFTQAVVVPSFSIVERDGCQVVFIAEKNQARLIHVVPGYETEEKRVILEGLGGSELLIIEGQRDLVGQEPLVTEKRS